MKFLQIASYCNCMWNLNTTYRIARKTYIISKPLFTYSINIRLHHQRKFCLLRVWRSMPFLKKKSILTNCVALIVMCQNMPDIACRKFDWRGWRKYFMTCVAMQKILLLAMEWASICLIQQTICSHSTRKKII